MAVGAQNDLGGQQTFARKMTWCIAFLCQNWDGFSAQIKVFSKKKKKKKKKKVFTEIWTVFPVQMKVFSKKKKKKKKVFTETKTVFWH